MSEARLARSKVWDWSMGSLEVALDSSRVHLRAARTLANWRALLASILNFQKSDHGRI